MGTALGVVVGLWVDNHWRTSPWGVVICTCLGIASGMYVLIKEAIKSNKD